MTDPLPTKEQPSQERQAFEKWLQDVHGLECAWQEKRNCYAALPIHIAWKAWQEGSKHSQETGAGDKP